MEIEQETVPLFHKNLKTQTQSASMKLLEIFKPEIWLTALATIIFIPLCRFLGQNPNFTLFKFGLLFVGLIAGIYLYAYYDMR